MIVTSDGSFAALSRTRLHVEHRAHVLLQVVVVPVALVAEGALHGVVAEVHVEHVSLVFPFGSELLAAVLARVDLRPEQLVRGQRVGGGRHLARQSPQQLLQSITIPLPSHIAHHAHNYT